jgi:exopolysaccharide biosynthesis protein
VCTIFPVSQTLTSKHQNLSQNKQQEMAKYGTDKHEKMNHCSKIFFSKRKASFEIKHIKLPNTVKHVIMIETTSTDMEMTLQSQT